MGGGGAWVVVCLGEGRGRRWEGMVGDGGRWVRGVGVGVGSALKRIVPASGWVEEFFGAEAMDGCVSR